MEVKLSQVGLIGFFTHVGLFSFVGHLPRSKDPRQLMEVPVRYRGGVIGLWCHCFCPSVYAHEADGPIGIVGFLVWDALNHLQEHPYQYMPHLYWEMPLLGIIGFSFIPSHFCQ